VRVRDDFDAAVFVDTAEHVWRPSPTPGVERMMLERVGDEDAVATSFVRYAPNMRFPHHVHGLGEEFIVLEGDFRDAAGCYTAGRYLRHPPGSAHAPWSEGGCLLFVKLKQFAPDDGAWVHRDLATLQRGAGGATARTVLHRFRDEGVEIIDARAGTCVHEAASNQVTELLVLDGRVVVNDKALGPLGWARLPRGTDVAIAFERDGRVWLKRRASDVDRAIARLKAA